MSLGAGEERGVTSCGAGAWGHPSETLGPQLAGLVLPTLQRHAWPRRQQSCSGSCRAAAGTGHRCRLLPSESAERRERLTLLSRARSHCQSRAEARPRRASRLSAAGAPGRLRVTRAAGAAAVATFAALVPVPLRDRAAHRMLETVKPPPPLPPWRPQRGPRVPAAAKSPRSPSATRSSRACSSRGGRYPGAPSRSRRSISRGGRGGGGGSLGSNPACAPARTPPSRPWPRAARPPPAAGGRQSALRSRRLARRGSGGGRCAGRAEREVRPGGSWRPVGGPALSRRPQGCGEPQVSVRQVDPSPARSARASEPRASASRAPSGFFSRLPPPPAPAGPPAALPARRVGAQPRRGDLASDPAQRGDSGSGAADPEPRRGGGRGGGGRGGQWRGAEPPAPRHHPRPPVLKPRPRPAPPPPPPRGSLAGTTVSGWRAAPPRARRGCGSSRPNSVWLLPKLHRRRGPPSLHPAPQTLALNSSPGFEQREAPLFVPGPGRGERAGAGAREEGGAPGRAGDEAGRRRESAVCEREVSAERPASRCPRRGERTSEPASRGRE